VSGTDQSSTVLLSVSMFFRYSPEHLLMENVVVVTINYRLHILGFMSLPSKGISGNNALKDQQLALQWIHENIANFNGDPHNICLFGESFGAGCTHLHVLNEKSRKFIKSAICQSGTAVTSVGFREYATDGDILKLAKLLGCKSESLDDALETLTKADVKDLYENCEKLPTPYETVTRLRRWRMVIEEESDDAFITKSPLELMKSQAGKIKIPMIFGTNDGDGMPRTAAALKRLPQLNEDITKVIMNTILSTAVSPNNLANDIKKFYFGGKDISTETLDCLIDFFTDLIYLGYQTVTIDLMAKFHPECKVFLNEFQYDGRWNIQKEQVKFQHMKRACHADDLYYLFGGVLVDQAKIEDNSIEANNRRTICRLWANFAKYGDPTPEKKSGLNFRWDSLDLEDMLRGECNVLALNDEPKMIRNLNKDRMDFFRRKFRYYDVDHLSSKL
jgi:carboxylesterase type B